MTDKQMSFGLLLNSTTEERWQKETVELLVKNGVQLKLVVMNDGENQSVSFGKKAFSYPYRKLFFRLWHRFFFKPKSKKPVSMEEVIRDVEVVKVRPIIKGVSAYFDDSDVEKIKSFDVDFLLRFGFDILRGEVLTAARYGVWSFHHDDERIVRGSPPGFWEFMRHIPSNGIILQRLTDSLDKGVVLRRMTLNTILHSYREHLDNLYFAGETLPLQVCRDISYDTFNAEPSVSQAPIFHTPNNCQMIKYWWLCFSRRVMFHFRRLFRQEDWNIGVCKSSSNTLTFDIQNVDIQWFTKCKNYEYFADPFLLKTQKDTYIFFEWFSYRRGKGVLAVRKKSEDFSKSYVVSSNENHLSYPFVFEDDGVVYCVPESNADEKVVLYRFNEELLALEEDTVLLSGRFVDSTLLYHENKWFLFTTPKKQSHSYLEIYVADDLRGPYRPHKNNPVVVDCRSARMAGKIIEKEGVLYRLGQNSECHYGSSVTLNRIVKLSEYQYVERYEKSYQQAEKWEFNQGLHTLNTADDLVVFDVKKFSFSFVGFVNSLMSYFKKK